MHSKDGLVLLRHSWLLFENCRVPAENVLGEVNHGFYAIMKNFQNERTVLGAQAIGEASKAIELTLDYVLKVRKAFGGVLWDKQAIRQRLSERMAQVESGPAVGLSCRVAGRAGH